VRLPSLSIALTHDAKPTGSTLLSTTLQLSTCPRAATAFAMPAGRPSVDLPSTARPRLTAQGQLPTAFLRRSTVRPAQRDEIALTFAQQKRPDAVGPRLT
jgi:hypothetical protein